MAPFAGARVAVAAVQDVATTAWLSGFSAATGRLRRLPSGLVMRDGVALSAAAAIGGPLGAQRRSLYPKRPLHGRVLTQNH